MEQTTLVKKLSALGLPEKDATTYLALLKLGPSPVQAITKETGLNRSSLYVVLERLSNQGLVSLSGERGVRKYVAVPPDRLERAAKEKLDEARLTEQALNTLLPDLVAIQKRSRHKPQMYVYPGKEGLRKGFERSLSNEEKVMRVFSSAEKIAESLPDYLPKYMQDRLRRGISMHGIHADGFVGRHIVSLIPKTIDKLLFLPPEDFTFPSDFAVYDQKVAFMSHDPALCIYIESEAIANIMKIIFELAQKESVRIGRDPYTQK